MKKYFILPILILLSCGGKDTFCDHACDVENRFPKLKKPIVVIAKESSWAGWSVLVRDANDSTLFMGNLSPIGRSIGESYNVGDTLK